MRGSLHHPRPVEDYAPRMRVWKLLGLAGILAGVATGAAVARDERVRRHYDAGEIRERLHARHDEAVAREAAAQED
jgi:hypothetical protein